MSGPFLFVSHVAEDRVSATELVAELERRNVRCWIAPRDVHPGAPYDDEIAAAIDDCRAMLLVFSERCNESAYIRREITVAGEARKLIIPFRIEDATPKRGLRVRLADLHWIDGFVAREAALDTLIRSVLPDEVIDSVEPEPKSEPRPAPPVRRESHADAEHDETLAGLLRDAEGGDADAQYLLGARYAHGNGVAEDPHRGAMWFRRAAEQGHANAQDSLGYLYSEGLGVDQDFAQSIAWYRRAAEQGLPMAEWCLGHMYRFGHGVDQDARQAAAWYRRAAEKGYAPAQNSLGELATMYEKGHGITPDYEEAAKQGNVDAAEAVERLSRTERGDAQYDESSKRDSDGNTKDALLAKASKQATSWTEFLFSPRGRVNRKEYWLWFGLPSSCIAILLGVIDGFSGLVDTRTGIGALSEIFSLAALFPSLILQIKRFHDRDKSGWWNLIMFIPIIGVLWVLIEVGFLRGTPGPNRFGPRAEALPRDAAMVT